MRNKRRKRSGEQRDVRVKETVILEERTKERKKGTKERKKWAQLGFIVARFGRLRLRGRIERKKE